MNESAFYMARHAYTEYERVCPVGLNGGPPGQGDDGTMTYDKKLFIVSFPQAGNASK